MTEHKCNWQLSEDCSAICLDCVTVIGADGLIESLQTENTKLQEEIAAIKGELENKDYWVALQDEIAALRAENLRVTDDCNRIIGENFIRGKRIAALEKVAEAAPELERVKYAWALYCGRGSKWDDAWREAGYLKEEG